ncbi:MAG: acylphosphatase [candidate division Zixibacteria bacterium]|nr:acylphosphatase [candidate division Zixibacteria bacterium]
MTVAGAIINVRGVVQGVGFRYWCLRKAKEYNINGYVANLYDGSVEIIAEGNKGLIEDFLGILRIGPTQGKVTDIRTQWYDKPRGYIDFRIEQRD